MKKPRIGFVGQGWIGKNYADDFEKRGYEVVRYALESPYNTNKDKIKECDMVFIAVPTPTTKRGFDDHIVCSVLPLVGKGKIAVIKSTLIMGRTKAIQKKFPYCKILHSPEFLSEKTAAHDAAFPDRNIVGVPIDNPLYQKAAELALSVMAPAPFKLICSSEEAELIKYAHNVHGYIQVVFSNILYDLVRAHGGGWEPVSLACKADPMMSHQYLNPVHKNGRGAGGGCFVKDYEAFVREYKRAVSDRKGVAALEAIREKNIELLVSTGKSIDLLESVYGSRIFGAKKGRRVRAKK
jgi:UDP-glucose 6-dehydrogenase